MTSKEMVALLREARDFIGKSRCSFGHSVSEVRDRAQKGLCPYCKHQVGLYQKLLTAEQRAAPGDAKGLAVIRAAQLDIAAKNLDRRNCHSLGEACRESAKLLREFAGVASAPDVKAEPR